MPHFWRKGRVGSVDVPTGTRTQEAPGAGNWQQEHNLPPCLLISDRCDDVTQRKNKLKKLIFIPASLYLLACLILLVEFEELVMWRVFIFEIETEYFNHEHYFDFKFKSRCLMNGWTEISVSAHIRVEKKQRYQNLG